LSTVGDRTVTRPVGKLSLKGFHRPVPAYELLEWRPTADAPTEARSDDRSRSGP
jgi:adenylate cyclase